MTSIVITTSHKPSQRTRSFAKDLGNMLPHSIIINRGKKTIDELAIIAYRARTRYFIVIGEKRGNPSLIRFYKVEYTGKMPYSKHIASIIIKGITLTRENPDATRTYGVESIGFNIDKCISDRCFHLHDLLYMVLEKYVSNKPDIILMMKDVGNSTIIKPVNKLGKVCGPVIKVFKVKKIE